MEGPDYNRVVDRLDELRHGCLNLARLQAGSVAEDEAYWKVEEAVSGERLGELRATLSELAHEPMVEAGRPPVGSTSAPVGLIQPLSVRLLLLLIAGLRAALRFLAGTLRARSLVGHVAVSVRVGRFDSTPSDQLGPWRRRSP